jgi:ABC-type sulfate transport system permease subunit
MDQFQSLPVIKLSRLEANDPTQLNNIQQTLSPHLPTIEMVLWTLWWGILFYLVARYLVLPLLSRAGRSEEQADLSLGQEELAAARDA